MLDLEDSWVWDFWLARDGATYHCFFLQAPRSLGDPNLRHRNASVGHAVSTDLRTWSFLADAVSPQPPPAFDDLATWTGCVVRGDETWHMFTTGISQSDDGLVQRIGASQSLDLVTWQRTPGAMLEADPRWYAAEGVRGRPTHWRDPWVSCGADGIWHLLATAQSYGAQSSGARSYGDQSGGKGGSALAAVVAHATSSDLSDWQVLPPVSGVSRRFAHAEVVSVVEVDGRWVLMFSCLADMMPGQPPGSGGVWTLPVAPPGTWDEDRRIDLDDAVRVTNERLYVGKVVLDPFDRWRFLAFVHEGDDGEFVGGITDPIDVTWRDDGRGLRLVDAPSAWLPPDERG